MSSQCSNYIHLLVRSGGWESKDTRAAAGKMIPSEKQQ